MKGLILRDLLIYFRRLNKSSYVTEGIMFLFFLGVSIGSPDIGLSAYVLLCLPIQMCAMPMSMKDMDSNYSGTILARLKPFTGKELVRSRFLSAFCIQGFYGIVGVIFCLLHGMIFGSMGFGQYVLMLIGGLLMGTVLTSMNLMAGFLGNINVTSVVYVAVIVAAAVVYIIMAALKINVAQVIARPSVLWICGVVFTGAVLLAAYKVSEYVFCAKRG